MSWIVRGDVDGFFGLALDNLVQLLLIETLCQFVLGFPPAIIYGRQAQPQNLEVLSKEMEDLIHHAISENLLVDLAVKDDARPKRLALVQERTRQGDGACRLGHAPAGARVEYSSQCDQRSLRPRTVSRYASWSSSVIGPTPISTSSISRSGVTSAAVPHMNASSAR